MKIYYIGSPEVFTEGASSIHVARMCEAFSKLGNEVTLMIPLASDCIDDFFSFYGVNKTFKINSCIGFGKGPKRHFLHGVVSFFKSIFLIKSSSYIQRECKTNPSDLTNSLPNSRFNFIFC